MFYGLFLGQLLLQHNDNLSKTLQSQNMSAAEGQKIAEMSICTLQSIRCDANFELFWKKVTDLAEELDVDDPVLPHQSKRPRRYDTGISEGSIHKQFKICIELPIMKPWILSLVASSPALISQDTRHTPNLKIFLLKQQTKKI